MFTFYAFRQLGEGKGNTVGLAIADGHEGVYRQRSGEVLQRHLIVVNRFR